MGVTGPSLPPSEPCSLRCLLLARFGLLGGMAVVPHMDGVTVAFDASDIISSSRLIRNFTRTYPVLIRH
jgi:hypothetical protein